MSDTERPKYRPGYSRVGEDTPQSAPEKFTDAEIRSEVRYLRRLNRTYGDHALRLIAIQKLETALIERAKVAKAS